MTYVVIYILCCLLSFILGLCVSVIRFRKFPSGIFHVDLSNPEKDTFRMEFLVDLDDAITKKGLYFTVQRDDRG